MNEIGMISGNSAATRESINWMETFALLVPVLAFASILTAAAAGHVLKIRDGCL